MKFFLDKFLKVPVVANKVSQNHIQNVMRTPVSPLNFHDVPFIIQKQCNNQIHSAFNFKYGGAHVFTAPPGSGKTTYLRNYCNEFIKSGGYVKLFGGELYSREIFEQTFGDSNHNLFDLLPKKSVIVLDQLEHNGKLSEEIKGLIRYLALESRRTAECNIILSMSDPQIAQEVLNLNGNDKIKQWGSSSDFEWSSEEVKEFIDKGCKGWSEEDRFALMELGCKAKCPSFLHGVFITCTNDLPKDRTKLKQSAQKCEDSWKAFKDLDL